MEKLTPEEMSIYSAQAEDVLTEMELKMSEPEQAVLTELATWWKKWYLTAGHKRLGRMLMKYASKEVQP